MTSQLPEVSASTFPLATSIRFTLALPCSPTPIRMVRPSRLHVGPPGIPPRGARCLGILNATVVITCAKF